MNFSSINIQGNIISSDILTKVRNDDMRYQKPADFNLDRNTTIRDEIGIAWAAAQAHWKAFSLRRDRLKETDSGTSETRNSWVIPFMRELGYELEVARAEIINEKSYAISHRAMNRDGFPVHIVGVNQNLDKRAEGGARLSPHALVQEYLNNNEHLYAITTNGKHLRLLRDATRLARLSYLEFDLQRMMDEELYAEFALLFRVLHASRMPERQDAGADSIIEFYHQEALASGTRIRERLSVAVEQSLKLLANGLLKNPANADLREKAERGSLNAEDYYLHLLRTVYRMLFLLVIEERGLIYPEQRDAELNRKRDIYYQFYSLQRLTKLVERKVYVDPRKTDLWRALMSNFALFERGHFGTKLGIQPLGAGLFSPAALGHVVNQQLDNETFLKVLRHLVMFENENHQWSRVNYADLDVEEFGSVYEGLLEYDPQISMVDDQPVFSFVEGTGRSSSGSHYTPEELVKPLIKHSLEYVIEDKLKAGKAEQADKYQAMLAQCRQLLTIKVCDVACGSGHILLSAARRIGMELAVLRESIDARQEVEQPSPSYLRQAVRDVIRHCIYGVDKNPLAVELCKVALWLEAHNPGEPLNFLDHRIKCGDAIVGLAHKEELKRGIATEAFKALSDAEKADGLARTLSKRNKEEREKREAIEANNLATQLTTELDYDLQAKVIAMDEAFAAFARMPETTPDEIEAKQRAYAKLQNSEAINRLRTMADMQVAQFFLSKTPNHKDYLVTDADYQRYLKGEKAYTHAQEAKWMQVAHEKRFFHYFLEFPEVFSAGGISTEAAVKDGFDTILGNPPFLGGSRISGHYGVDYLSFIQSVNPSMKGQADLVGYFFLRIYELIANNAFLALISTNTISQGDTREGSLLKITENSGSIHFATRNTKWPGLAAVVVNLISISKNRAVIPKILDSKEVEYISHFLDSEVDYGAPMPLQINLLKSFKGSEVVGDGFFLESSYAQELLSRNAGFKEVVKPYINGKDLSSTPDQKPGRWIISFGSMEKSESSKRFPELFKIVEEKVKPERASNKDKRRREIWWQFSRPTTELYQSIDSLNNVLAIAQTGKTGAIVILPKGYVYSSMIVVFAFDDFGNFSFLQSCVHDVWSWKYCSTMGSSTLRYTPTSAFETIPFPKLTDTMLRIGESYYHERQAFIKESAVGMTEFYNEFHDGSNKPMDKYRSLHKQMDQAVLEAYGWAFDSDQGPAIDLRHDFYEVEYLPENDRVRYTIHPDARKEVLKRLLKLNHQRFEEEVAQGLHKQADVVKYYEQKGQPIPAGVRFSDGKKSTKSKTTTKETKDVDFGLFGGENE